MNKLTEEGLDLLFRTARTQNGFTPTDVSDELLHEIWDLAKMGPTSVNGLPLRAFFIRTPEAKERLLHVVGAGNHAKTKSAPVTAIFAYDAEFYEKLPKLFPHADLRGYFAGNADLAQTTARDNTFLQIAYFMLAARSLGIDCGPIAGFDAAKANAEFFAGTTWKAVLVCNLGYGDATKLFPRSPRLAFEEAAQIL